MSFINQSIHRFPALILLAVLVSAGVSLADAPKTGMIQFPAGTTGAGGAAPDMVSAFVAEPTTSARHPGVILIHTWWGLNDWIKEQTQKLADQGFVALAIDLYDGHVATDPNTAQDLRVQESAKVIDDDKQEHAAEPRHGSFPFKPVQALR